MIESLALDALLVLILLLLIPIGLYRGGLREVCTAAGLLLGFLIADAWSERWGGWVADVSGIDPDVSRFVVATAVLVVATGAVGYGAAASFSYRPGPGGRLYGGLISVFAGLVFIGALIEFVRRYLHDGELPAIVRDGHVSKALSAGFDWVLLVVAGGVLGATIFGMFVRERDQDEFMLEIPQDQPSLRRATPLPVAAPEPEVLDAAKSGASGGLIPEPTATVRIREVRHWEDHSPPSPADLQSGWTQTWPATDREPTIKGRGAIGRNRIPSAQRGGGPAPAPDEDVLRTWLEQDRRSTPGQGDRKPQSDE